MLTRKDYKVIAAILSHFGEREIELYARIDDWNWLCFNVCQWLRKDNPKFDQSRFMKAAEPDRIENYVD